MKHEPIYIYGDGGNVRDYIYIEDAAQGIVNIALNKTSEKIFNLGSGKGTSLLKIIKIIEDALNIKAEIKYLPSRAIDVRYSVLDISKYKNAFPEHYIMSPEIGINQIINEIKVNGFEYK